MGAALTYLSGPEAVTTVKIDHQSWDKTKPISSAAASMQGWRRSMEDAHFMKYFPNQNVYLFGVFDGHGGSGVSRYCAKRLPELIESNESFKARNFDVALHESFLDLDLETQEPNVQEQLFQLHLDSKNHHSGQDLKKIEIHLAFETILDLFLGDPTDPVNHPPDPFKVFLDDYTVPNPLDLPVTVPPTPVQLTPEHTPAPSPAGPSHPPPSARKRRSATLKYGSQGEGSGKYTTEPKSPWGEIATILRKEGRISSDLKRLIELFDLSLGLTGGVAEGDPPPLLRLKPPNQLTNWEDESVIQNPVKFFFEGTLATMFKPTTDIPWVYAIHPIDLLAALNNNHMVAEEDTDGTRKIRRCVSDDQGCTANVCLLSLNETPAPLLFCANAGDSRAILIRSNPDNGTAKAVPLSIDHKPSLPGERRRILHAGGRIVGKMDPRVQGDLNLSRAIGDWRHKQNFNLPIELQMISPRPDITITEIGKHDQYILLGCDGIWERFSSSECADFVDTLFSSGSNGNLSPRRKIFLQHHYGIHLDNRRSSDMEYVCEQICHATVRKQDEFPGMPVGVTIGCDNMSVVLVRVGGQVRDGLEEMGEGGSSSTLPVITYGAQVPDDWQPPETRKRVRKQIIDSQPVAKRKKSVSPSPEASPDIGE